MRLIWRRHRQQVFVHCLTWIQKLPTRLFSRPYTPASAHGKAAKGKFQAGKPLYPPTVANSLLKRWTGPCGEKKVPLPFMKEKTPSSPGYWMAQRRVMKYPCRNREKKNKLF